ncbi:MAG TPA: Fe2+-dependent dioxygenase [Pseudomonadales bacterium]|nr:Fe2+-dependent dioxygenase [Pseudomonadales bacterium]
MLTVIENVFSKAEVATFREALDGATWEDGLATAGTLASRVKQNEQLNEHTPLARQLGQQVLQRLGNHPLFVSAALPNTIYPPKFNRYRDGGHYGLHVDSAVMALPGTPQLMRSDLSATLFLCEPDEYDGGELMVEIRFGAQAAKLSAGDLVLYPSSSLHQVLPVTRGARVCCFLWLQSLVRDEEDRTVLFDLDQSIQSLTQAVGPSHPEVLRLSQVYHNLLRRWAES